MSGAGRLPRSLGQPLLDAFCLQSLSCQGPRSHLSLELRRECRGHEKPSMGAATFVESWPGAGRGSQPSALQRWEGPLQKGPHPWGASSPGSSRGSCLPSSVQRHLLDSRSLPLDSPSGPVPQPRVLLGGGCCSPSQPPTPQACDAGARTPQPGGGSLLAPGHGPHVPGSLGPGAPRWSPSLWYCPHPLPGEPVGPAPPSMAETWESGPEAWSHLFLSASPLKTHRLLYLPMGELGWHTHREGPTHTGPGRLARAPSPPAGTSFRRLGCALPAYLPPKELLPMRASPPETLPQRAEGGLLPVPPTGCTAPGPRCP